MVSEPNRMGVMDLAAHKTPIPGLFVVDLPVHGDNRGWFKENWQRQKMTALGIPDFGPVQNNISFNNEIGTTRGIHAEPWDKWVSVATGRIFGAWVDLREGPTFGTLFTAEVGVGTAVFVPRGVGNSYQTLEPSTAYTYLVNRHWSQSARYSYVNLADESLNIEWPIPLSSSEISVKDRDHPGINDVPPIQPMKTLVVGANGQLGRALREVFGNAPHIEYTTREQLDLTDRDLATARPWDEYDTIINAAAFTAVDRAETVTGRREAWAANVAGVAELTRIATLHSIALVHVSSDYVFDGDLGRAYREDDPFSPLSVYGQTKAAGDAIVASTQRHYIIRTSWVIGEGANFVRTMTRLAETGAHPRVVDDQLGRLTFAIDIAAAIHHLLSSGSPSGTYNVSCDGPATTWAELAATVFRLNGSDPADVTGVSTQTYFAAAQGPVASRPRNSMLDLEKIRSTGFKPRQMDQALEQYVLVLRGD